MTARRWHNGGGVSAPSGHGTGTIEEGRRRGEGVWYSTRVWVPFYTVGGRRGRAAAVIGAFMAAVTGSEGGGAGGNYDRLKRGGVIGG
jgi:hypothetical protein